MKFAACLSLLLLFPGLTRASEFRLPDGSATHIAVAPTNSQIIAARVNKRLYLSRNGGQHWTLVASIFSAVDEATDAAADIQHDPLFSDDPEMAHDGFEGSNTVAIVPTDEIESSSTPFLFTVDDEGNIAFWHSDNSRLYLCTPTGTCRYLKTTVGATAIQLDGQRVLWISTLRRLIRLPLEGPARSIGVTDIRQLLYLPHAKQMVARTRDTLRFIDQDNGRVQFIEPLPTGTTHASVYQHRVFILNHRDILERGNDGSFTLFARTPDRAAVFILSEYGIWYRSSDRWYFKPFTRVSLTVGTAACHLPPLPIPSPLTQTTKLPTPRPLLRLLLPSIQVRIRYTRGQSVAFGSDADPVFETRANLFASIVLQWRFSPEKNSNWFTLQEQQSVIQDAVRQKKISLRRAVQMECARMQQTDSLFERTRHRLNIEQITSQLSHLGH
ncbi:MAG: hypothetical protein JXX29_17560 [Deltaproteobacteria bacterium]|nr:hypothetical protein [Deltaproteobacteria bacterium]MBN2673492.1 hypothetical protein [Deltaproteobacteria bacterium]